MKLRVSVLSLFKQKNSSDVYHLCYLCYIFPYPNERKKVTAATDREQLNAYMCENVVFAKHRIYNDGGKNESFN